MEFLHKEIGAAKDNQNSPIHNWYKFTAGFSYKFVDSIISLEHGIGNEEITLFDPFAGCGTTLVSSQKKAVTAFGNEGQPFMYEIIKAKLNWNISQDGYNKCITNIDLFVSNCMKEDRDVTEYAHPLLVSLYSQEALSMIYFIRNSLKEIKSERYRLFFKLALSQTLHKVALHPIAIPYIVRTKKLLNNKPVWEVFLSICQKMLSDIADLQNKKATSKVYNHDSRKKNRFIKDSSCNLCVTSPPYLNNLDYGEVSKVHSHFFGLTNTWNDVTMKVRKKLVTGSTTHYKQSDFKLEDYKNSEFAKVNKNLLPELLSLHHEIERVSKSRSGKKSYSILMLYYLKDMYSVFVELKRVLKNKSKAYLILGDSAPYGVFIPTTNLLAEIAKNVGLGEYEIHKIRTRGSKWKSLKYRHKLELNENLLVFNS